MVGICGAGFAHGGGNVRDDCESGWISAVFLGLWGVSPNVLIADWGCRKWVGGGLYQNM